jgi:hypothetical protein
MPINIYEKDTFKTITILCDDDWDLSSQLDYLEKWIGNNLEMVSLVECVADIGFSIRKDASGGGGVLTKNCIGLLNQSRLEVYFSEYNP